MGGRWRIEAWLAGWMLGITALLGGTGCELICIAGICHGEPAVVDVSFVEPGEGDSVTGTVTITIDLDLTVGGLQEGWTSSMTVSDDSGVILSYDPGGEGRTTMTWTPTGAARTINLTAWGYVMNADEGNGQDAYVSFEWAP